MNELKENNGQLVLVKTGNDWEGLYVKGKLVEEHHHVDLLTISEYSAKLGMVVEIRFTTDEETERTEDRGNFLEDLSSMELNPE